MNFSQASSGTRISPPTNYYVYAMFYPDTAEPCYIGKGVGPRINHRGIHNTELNDLFIRYSDLPKIKIHEGLTNLVACQFETVLINALGCIPDGGPLLNKKPGGVRRRPPKWEELPCEDEVDNPESGPQAFVNLYAAHRARAISPASFSKQLAMLRGNLTTPLKSRAA